ncbi:MAG: GspH/FimT family pseudopilin [Burkholderiales bacterium]|nr:GspH/FimT family pseudopilin [Burkholderiales bacterium]
MLIRKPQRGVSIVEIVIALGIMALLLALGVPQYATFLNNARIRATTDNLTAGLNLARSEAVKRNARVEFVMTDEEPIASLVNTLPASTSGMNWVVREWVPASGTFTFIEGKSGLESSGRDEATPIVIASSSADATYAGIVSFNGFGAASVTRPLQFQISNPSGGACAAAPTPGPMRCLNIIVSPGGQVRQCDPRVTAAGDTRAC